MNSDLPTAAAPTFFNKDEEAAASRILKDIADGTHHDIVPGLAQAYAHLAGAAATRQSTVLDASRRQSASEDFHGR